MRKVALPASKYYVVWIGRKRGIYTSWAECERQVKGFINAKFKGFATRAEAERAFRSSYSAFQGRPSSQGRWKHSSDRPVLPSLCVDAACSGPTGPMEYRGVHTEDGEPIFSAGPFAGGTNNIGEFLAIVHALEWLEKHAVRVPVYSDSENALAWVTSGKCRTKLKHTARTAAVFALIRSAENWLDANRLTEGAILKWETRRWGENPADFARK